MISGSGAAREYTTTIPTLDLSGYSVNDSIRLAYYKYDNNLASIKIRFYSSSTEYYETTITPASGTGNFITSNILLSSVTFDPEFGLISRSVVTALNKAAGRQVDVEYRLELGF